MSAPHLLDAHGDTVPPRSWLREQLTLPNIVLLCSITFGVGGYITSFQALQQRVDKIERDLPGTYERQDVNQKAWLRIEEQLADIKADLRELKAQR